MRAEEAIKYDKMFIQANIYIQTILTKECQVGYKNVKWMSNESQVGYKMCEDILRSMKFLNEVLRKLYTFLRRYNTWECHVNYASQESHQDKKHY